MLNKLQSISFKAKVFLAMGFFLLFTFACTFFITKILHKKQVQQYNSDRFNRKTEAILSDIYYDLKNLNLAKLDDIKNSPLGQWIYEIADVHKVDITCYDLKGIYLTSSIPKELENILRLPPQILKDLQQHGELRYMEDFPDDGKSFQSTFIYVKDNDGHNVGIINMYYLQDNSLQNEELQAFLKYLILTYLGIFVFGMVIAYYLSNYITKSLNAIIEKMQSIHLSKKNQKINMENPSKEIKNLIKVYNIMVDKLEKSAEELSQNQREMAWKQMARQVAHEVNNPLTPMRLYIQNFQKNFRPDDPNIKEKLEDYTNVLTQQIDTMVTTVNKFYHYTDLDKKNDEYIEVISRVKNILSIFQGVDIDFQSEIKEFYIRIDGELLQRIFTNLIKNAVQATEHIKKPEIKIVIKDTKQMLVFEISDNGKGIPKQIQDKVFQPRFTTKTAGKGLGLSIVKGIVESYKGTLDFKTSQGKGTTFYLKIPK